MGVEGGGGASWDPISLPFIIVSPSPSSGKEDEEGSGAKVL